MRISFPGLVNSSGDRFEGYDLNTASTIRVVSDSISCVVLISILFNVHDSHVMILFSYVRVSVKIGTQIG